MHLEGKSVGILTLGCKVNQYESEVIAEELSRLGARVLPWEEVCDAYVINSCTVTAEAARKSRQMVRRLRQKNPDAFIVVTGCVSQSEPQSIAAIAGVDAVIGNREKLEVVRELQRLFCAGAKREEASICAEPLDGAPFEPMTLRSFPRTRAYVKIEDGCENRCTYCAIPGARGPVRSKSPDDIIAEVAPLFESGVPEVVITGIETASYGRDIDGASLSDVLTRLDKVTKGGRIRLGSLCPTLFRESFVDEISGLRFLAPHFHISLQSGCSRTLAAMKRKYNAAQAAAALQRIRAAMPDVMFTTDVIVGFPGETEADYLETEEFMKKARFMSAHIFPYSRREGTPAAEMKDQVPAEIKHERAARLSRLQEEIGREVLSEYIEKGPIREVLFETGEGGVYTGHTPHFVEVRAESRDDLRGKKRRVLLTLLDDGGVSGQILEN